MRSNKGNTTESEVAAGHAYNTSAATTKARTQPRGFRHFINNQQGNICIRGGNVTTDAREKKRNYKTGAGGLRKTDARHVQGLVKGHHSLSAKPCKQGTQTVYDSTSTALA